MFLHQEWVTAEDNGRDFDLIAGVGCGSTMLGAAVRDRSSSRSVHARASIKPVTAQLWTAMEQLLDGKEPPAVLVDPPPPPALVAEILDVLRSPAPTLAKIAGILRAYDVQGVPDHPGRRGGGRRG
jgi:hypothetical protein